jgi:hypothetical protein
MSVATVVSLVRIIVQILTVLLKVFVSLDGLLSDIQSSSATGASDSPIAEPYKGVAAKVDPKDLPLGFIRYLDSSDMPIPTAFELEHFGIPGDEFFQLTPREQRETYLSAYAKIFSEDPAGAPLTELEVDAFNWTSPELKDHYLSL